MLLVNQERKKVKSLNHVRLFVTPWTIAYQAPPSVGFSRQEYWSGLPFPSLVNEEIKCKMPSNQLVFDTHLVTVGFFFPDHSSCSWIIPEFLQPSLLCSSLQLPGLFTLKSQPCALFSCCTTGSLSTRWIHEGGTPSSAQ